MMDPLLDVHEAAVLLHLSESKVYKLVEKRAIPFFKVGRKVLFDVERVKSWLENDKLVEKRDPGALIKRPAAFNPDKLSRR